MTNKRVKTKGSSKNYERREFWEEIAGKLVQITNLFDLFQTLGKLVECLLSQ